MSNLIDALLKPQDLGACLGVVGEIARLQDPQKIIDLWLRSLPGLDIMRISRLACPAKSIAVSMIQITKLCWIACVFALFASPATAQNTDPVQAAIKAYRKVQDSSESLRSSKVAALGYHKGTEVESILLAELRAAETVGLKLAALDAIGRSKREGASELLIHSLQSEQKSYWLQRSAARALANQGETAIESLIQLMGEGLGSSSKISPDAKRIRDACLYGLSFAHTASAWRALASAANAKSTTYLERRLIISYLKDAPPSPELTALRLDCAEGSDLWIAAVCVRQLAEHGYPKVKAHILRLHKESVSKFSPLASSARTELVYAMAVVLSRDLYHPIVTQFSYASEATNRVQKELSKSLAGNERFVRWMTTRGLKLKSSSERIVITRLLSMASDLPDQEKITSTLIKLARSRDSAVAYPAIRSLGQRGDKTAIPDLMRILRSPGDLRRVETALALHNLYKDDPAWGSVLHDLLKKGDDALRATALDLLAEIGSTVGLKFAYADMRRKSWERRAAAYDYCRIVRSTRSVAPLIARIDVERGRLKEDVLDTLQSLTALRFSTTARWEQWWDLNQMTFELVPLKLEPEKTKTRRPKPKTTTYYNIPLVSDRVTFVVDTSGSMNQRVGTGKSTRLDEAKRQLKRVIDALPNDFRFNIVFFESSVRALFEKLQSASEKTKRRSLTVVDETKPAGGTNLFDAIELAFRDSTIDTIYLLSDGYPNAGRITDSVAIAAEIERWNRTRQIRIHCISIGQDSTLLKRIAEHAGGQYVYVR